VRQRKASNYQKRSVVCTCPWRSAAIFLSRNHGETILKAQPTPIVCGFWYK
jgi:hypothetical protein